MHNPSNYVLPLFAFIKAAGAAESLLSEKEGRWDAKTEGDDTENVTD